MSRKMIEVRWNEPYLVSSNGTPIASVSERSDGMWAAALGSTVMVTFGARETKGMAMEFVEKALGVITEPTDAGAGEAYRDKRAMPE